VLFERIYARLGEGQSVTLAGLLSDLAMNGEQALADVLTQADAEVEARTLDRVDLADELMATAVRALLDQQRESAYRQTKEAYYGQAAAEPNETDKAHLIRQMIEHRRDNPSPVRIARTKG
jgi:hypothetical protein